MKKYTSRRKNHTRKLSNRKKGGGFFRNSRSSRTSRSRSLPSLKTDLYVSYSDIKNVYLIRRVDSSKNERSTTKKFRDFVQFKKELEKCMKTCTNIWRGIRISNALRRMNFLNKNTIQKQGHFTNDITSWIRSIISCYLKLEKFVGFKTHRNVENSRTVKNHGDFDLSSRFTVSYNPYRTSENNKEIYDLQYSTRLLRGNQTVHKEYSDIEKLRKKIETQNKKLDKYWKLVTRYGPVKSTSHVKNESASDYHKRTTKLINIGKSLNKWLHEVMKIKYIIIESFTQNSVNVKAISSNPGDM